MSRRRHPSVRGVLASIVCRGGPILITASEVAGKGVALNGTNWRILSSRTTLVVIALSSALVLFAGCATTHDDLDASAPSGEGDATEQVGSPLDTPDSAGTATSPEQADEGTRSSDDASQSRDAADSASGAAPPATAHDGAIAAADHEPPPAPLIGVDALSEIFRSVAAKVIPTVVRIDVVEVSSQTGPGSTDAPWFDFFFSDPDGGREYPEFRNEGVGSGIIVHREGDTYFVLTNDHVIAEADEIRVTLDDGRVYSANRVGEDDRRDLAVVSFSEPAETLPVAEFGDSDSLLVGDWVIAIGSPYGFQSTVTAGIVSALGRRGGPSGNISDFIQTDAAINQGNSGGALADMDGKIVGINTWITSQTGGSIGLGFSIPVNNARRVVRDLVVYGEVRDGWLGVNVSDLSEEIAEALSADLGQGALVRNVFLDSPADEAGLLPGDVIVRIGGRPVGGSAEVVAVVGDLVVDEAVDFDVLRDGDSLALSVRIGVRADARSLALNTAQWPGMSVYPITEEIRERAGLADPLSGVVVGSVEPRSPAAAAGLRIGDVITDLDGVSVTGLREFYRILADGGRLGLSIRLLREGTPIDTALSAPAVR